MRASDLIDGGGRASEFALTHLAPSPQVRQELLLGHLVQLWGLGLIVRVGEVERLLVLVEENSGLGMTWVGGGRGQSMRGQSEGREGRPGRLVRGQGNHLPCRRPRRRAGVRNRSVGTKIRISQRVGWSASAKPIDGWIRCGREAKGRISRRLFVIHSAPFHSLVR